MEYYKFVTTISEDGKIQVPDDRSSFFNKEVEITIAPKQPIPKKAKATDFVSKWAGTLKVENTNDAKYKYIMEKHQ